MSKWLTKLVIFALRNKKLSKEDKNRLLGTLIENHFLPINDIISWDKETGQLLVGGKLLDRETTLQLRESAKNVLSSTARRIVQEQVTFDAIKEGIHKGTGLDTILFAKAVIWLQEKETYFLNLIAQQE